MFLTRQVQANTIAHSIFGYWLLVIGDWLLVIGKLSTSYQLPVTNIEV